MLNELVFLGIMIVVVTLGVLIGKAMGSGGFGFFFISMLGIFAFVGVGYSWGEETTVTTTTPLQSLGSVTTAGGQLYLGTGTIEGERSLNFSTLEGSGKLNLLNAKVSESEVFVKEGVEPKVTTTVTMFAMDLPFMTSVDPDEKSRHYVFEVPTGSVSSEVMVDNG